MANYDTIEYVTSVVSDTLRAMGITARVEYEDSLSRGLVFNIRTRDSRLLIGQRGTTLQALEHVIHAMVARKLPHTEPPTRFSIDVDDYKKNREWALKQLIKDSIQKVKTSGQAVTLPVMSRYERRFVHAYVQEQFPHITTESFGEDPQRKIKLSL